MLRGQCWELGKEQRGLGPPEGVHLQVPRGPGTQTLQLKGPACGEQWRVLTRGAEEGVLEPQSYRGAGQPEMEGKGLPGHIGSSCKQKGGVEGGKDGGRR